MLPLCLLFAAINGLAQGPVLWNIKAVLPNGTTLDVKALDPSGRILSLIHI